MDWEIFKIVTPYIMTLFGVLASLVGFMWKNIHERIKKIEHKLDQMVTVHQTRTMIDDRVLPLAKEVVENKKDNVNAMARLENQLTRIYDLLLSMKDR